MPELPEVETMRRGILAAIGGQVRDVVVLRCSRKPIHVSPRPATLRKRLTGRRVCAIERLGKRVVMRFEGGDALVFEPRMTGLVLVADPPSTEHLRLRVDLSGSTLPAIWYWDRRGLGNVRLLSAEAFVRELGAAKIGPDAMAVTAEEFRERFVGSRREVKVALLDQRAVAGIGNLYAAEILHCAGVHPQSRCEQLTHSQWQRIFACCREVLVAAIEHEGSTLSDGTYRNALSNPGSYQHHHRVYDREGEACPTCRRGTIRRIVQSQRATFFCPVCQRAPRRRR